LSWCKVNLSCSRNDVSIIEEILVANEAISISLCDEINNNPIYEPKVGDTPLWQIVKLIALFEEIISREVITNLLEGIPYSNLIIGKLENQNWIEKYQENFKPIRFGEKLWVVPSWSQELSIPEMIQLKMDPGMAFGSGSHETTQLCLEYLESHNIQGSTVIDYGCGSGILAIAAKLLGARKVFAFDNDPQALISTKQNAEQNNVGEYINIININNSINTKVDILIANIFLNTLIELRSTFLNSINNKGKIVLSGIQESQLAQIINYYSEYTNVLSIKKSNNWCIIELEKNL